MTVVGGLSMSISVLMRSVSSLALIVVFSSISVAARAQSAEQLPTIEVIADKPAQGKSDKEVTTPPIAARQDLPNTTASATEKKLEDTVNIVDSEDAVKYFPSLFVRKRNEGDTQPVLETRNWGVNSSARSLVYADDILLSALIANNNTIGAPRWGMIAPEEIQRVDFLYGPYAAAYPGNSMGGVLQYTTRMPDKFSWDFNQTEAFQTFKQYGTNKVLPTSQSNFAIGDRIEAFRWFLTGNFQDSYSQPLSYVTNGSAPAGTSGTYSALNKTGAVADVVGAGGMLHTDMSNIKLKLSLDLTDWLTATYTLGFWENNGHSNVQSYLTNTTTGQPTFGNVNGFGSNYYSINEQHLANSLSLKTDTKGDWDWDVSYSRYDFLNDIQRSPFAVQQNNTATFSTFGKITRLDGTNWQDGDAKAIWRPFGPNGQHEVTFGVHGDQENLSNPVYQTATWNSGSDTGTGVLYSTSKGTTQTGALFLQDAWKFLPTYKLTLGGRFESWEALNGYTLATTSNASTGVITGSQGVNQATANATRFSPKANLTWDPNQDWTVSASFGVANRFPTVSELYQTVTSGSNISTPNANLTPERALDSDLTLVRHFQDGLARVSIFNEDTYNAIVSQTSYIPPNTTTTYTVINNVNHVRNTGVEVYGEENNVLIQGLQLSGSVTYVDSRIISDPNWAAATTVVGKHVPYVPDWRSTLAATYRPDDKWAFTAALRYSGKQYSTLDNTDTVSNVMGSFNSFTVVDLHANYNVTNYAKVQVGIDNLFNEQYFLYHPFPGRTYMASAKINF